jgi:hypothetical protein
MTTALWGDCERIGGGWPEQPVNAWSSLSFAAVGVVVTASGASASGRERIDRIAFGLLLIATGAASFAYHGEPAAARYWHDVAFLSALWFLVTANAAAASRMNPHASRLVEFGGILAIALVLAIAPAATNTLNAGLLLGLVGSDLASWRRSPPLLGWYALAVGAGLAGMAFFLLGREGSPWCDPSSALQFHAGWHVLVAVAFGSYFLATAPVRTDTE